MGYGEVGGGGSLQWQMTHSNKKPKHVPPIPGKPTQQGEGIDPDVNDGDDLYLVIKRGVVILANTDQVLVKVKLDKHDDVQLVWGAQAVALKEAVNSAVTAIDLSKLGTDRSEAV